MSSDLTTNRYGSIAAEIYDLDKPYFALPDTAFHLWTPPSAQVRIWGVTDA